MRKLPTLLLAVLAAVPAASAPLLVNSIQGIYTVRHKIAMYDGSLPPGQFHMVEDVLEIVPVSHGGAYLRVHATFDNGHICGVHGVAKPEGDVLVYRPHDNFERKCELSLKRRGDRLVFGDPDDACKYDFCGMRGNFIGESFPLSSRRPIRYMPRLLASREYAEAMAEQGMAPPPPRVAVAVEPLHANGRFAQYPRLTAFPDKVILAKFNAMIAKDEAEDHRDRDDCIAFLQAHRPDDARVYRVDMRVTYLTPRYLSMTLTANRTCSGAPAKGIANPRIIDLSTLEDVDPRSLFNPGFFTDLRDQEDSGQLAALYRARHSSQNADCRKEIASQSFTFGLWLDAQRGVVVQPESGISPDCALAMALSPKDIAPYVEDARFIADLKATVRNQD